MSRFVWLAMVCACGWALNAAPGVAKDPRQRADQLKERPDPPEILQAALKQKVEFDGTKIGEMLLTEVLQKLATKHKVTFVIMEEHFKAKKIDDIKEKKSRVKNLDTKGMTVTGLLDAWLPSLGATYTIHEDYVAVVPLPAKVQEPNPVLRLRRPNQNANEEPKPAKKADPTERLLGVLAQDFDLGDRILNEIPMAELLQFVSKKHEMTITINEESFRLVSQPNFPEEKPKFRATQLKGMTVHQFLNTTLDSVGATYLIRNGAIEIVSTRHAAKVTKSTVSEDEDGRTRLNEPLVSAIVKEKPLNEVVAKIAEQYDLTVIVSPQAGDARTGFVTARMLNTPADKALELLALQCDLRVVRKGKAFFITSRDHANELFSEKLEKQRQMIELQKFREAPVKPPIPPAPPEK